MDTVDEAQEEVTSDVDSLHSDLQDSFEEELDHEVDTHETVIDDLKPYGQDEYKEQLFDALWELGNEKEGLDGVSVEEFAEAHHRKQKKNLKSLAESNRKTLEEISELEDSDPEWMKLKRVWKEQNPTRTLKEYKDAYEREKINHLPWDPEHFEYKQNDEQNENSIWNKIRNGNSSNNSS